MSNERLSDLSRRIIRARVQKRVDVLRELSRREGWDLTDKALLALSEQNEPITRSVAATDIIRLAEENSDLIAGIQLHSSDDTDMMASAMIATSSNIAVGQSNTRGDGIGIYMTEETCPNTTHAYLSGHYTRLSGSEAQHSRGTTGIIRSAAPGAYIYCKAPSTIPNNTDLAGSGGHPQVHIINRSAGNPSSSEYGTMDRDWDNLVLNTNVVAFIGAGNEGGAGGTGWIRSPAKGLNVVTVGAYDDATNHIKNNSSYLDPTNTHNQKPELVAPGVSITAGGYTQQGTSFASPHAAAIAADWMQSSPWQMFRPHVAKAKAMVAATDVITGGVDRTGVGGIDFSSGYSTGHNWWWTGSNGDFTTWANGDGFPNNNSVDVTFSFNAGHQVRVVATWLNRGTWVYDHRNDAHPIGVDFDLTVYRPDGSVYASSSSYDNPYEMVNFTAPVSGAYRIQVRRYANRDTSAPTRLALSVNW